MGDDALVGRCAEHHVNCFSDAQHVGLDHAAAGHCRGAEADAAGLEGAACFARDGVFIGGDVGGVQCDLRDFTSEFRVFFAQVDHHQMIIGATADDVVAALDQCIRECFGIGGDLCLIGFEVVGRCFLEAHRFGCDDMHQWAALRAGEDCRVDLFGVCGFTQYQSATRAAQGLVCSGGDKVSMRYWRGVNLCCDQTSDVCDIGQQVSTDFAGDFTHPLKVNDPRVGRCTDSNHLRLLGACGCGDRIIIDQAILDVDTVIDDIMVDAAEVHWVAVCEVAAVGEIHGENLVPWA